MTFFFKTIVISKQDPQFESFLTYFSALEEEHIGNIIQFMHSFEFNHRIRQPENSGGEAHVNIIFEGRLILMLTEKNHQLFGFMILHPFS